MRYRNSAAPKSENPTRWRRWGFQAQPLSRKDEYEMDCKTETKVRLSVQKGLEIDTESTPALGRAICYAICIVSTAFSAWLVITAVRWW